MEDIYTYIKRNTKFNEPIEIHYYEKLIIQQVPLWSSISRRRALALRYSESERLLQYLISNKENNKI